MRKIKVWASTKYVRSEDYEVIEVDDDVTPDEIEEIAREAMFELISWGWENMVEDED